MLRLLLSAAFGLSLEDLAPLNKQKPSSKMLNKAASFHDMCSCYVGPKGGEIKQGEEGSCSGYPLRAVLFDIIHSVRP